MLKFLKFSLITFFTLIACASMIIYLVLRASLPSLDGERPVVKLTSDVSLKRDSLGQVIITASNREEAAYALGFAHAQDRLFQMDAQRRTASGRLSELLGNLTIKMDQNARFYQFEMRAQQILPSLPKWQQRTLANYAQGVNDAVSEFTVLPLEYVLTRNKFAPWKPEDSILVIYSMYMDLQSGQVARDMAFTRIAEHFGDEFVDFILQPSHHQAALDGSRLVDTATIPELPPWLARLHLPIQEPKDIGSNNWAVSGALTDSGSAMLANDMHLHLRVPIIWYRAQLNYTQDNERVAITGVTLPGLPGIVVGTNGHIAWGFTNANLDNTDWVALSPADEIETTSSVIIVKRAESLLYTHLKSQYGPVKRIAGSEYALSWTALQPYAANLNVINLDTVNSVSEAITLGKDFGMPVQNFTVVDAAGNIAWTPAGAVTARTTPSNKAIPHADFDAKWAHAETQLPTVINPTNHRLWTANARVISTTDFTRFGDGGYAVGARGEQIRDRLFEQEQFNESDFYRIQLDNEARFLIPWHALLFRTLSSDKGSYETALSHLDNWQSCACENSVGYTLVRRFRAAVIAALFDPITTRLAKENVSFRPIIRHIEPATWDLINTQPESWLPDDYNDWPSFLRSTFDVSLERLMSQHGDDPSLLQLRWGEVNRLKIKHPLGDVIPVFGKQLHMITQSGFGDRFMPSVQAPGFGASQRLFVRPGNLDKAILTLPGGQSSHVLSPYYRAGFADYIEHKSTPLLPQETVHHILFSSAK